MSNLSLSFASVTSKTNKNHSNTFLINHIKLLQYFGFKLFKKDEIVWTMLTWVFLSRLSRRCWGVFGAPSFPWLSTIIRISTIIIASSKITFLIIRDLIKFNPMEGLHLWDYLWNEEVWDIPDLVELSLHWRYYVAVLGA